MAQTIMAKTDPYEVLRDVARNEDEDFALRCAAVKTLLEQNHPFANDPDFDVMRYKIEKESEAEKLLRTI
jgi:hypothetical protein